MARSQLLWASFFSVVLLAPTASAQFLPPVIRKLFAQSPILVGQTTPLTFTITSASPLGSPGTTFSDTLPAGLVIATPNGFSGGCGSGAVTAVSGTSVISLAPTSIPGGSSCSFSVNVLATAAGTFVNTTTNVTNTTVGPGNQAVDVLVVVPARTPQPPVLSKFFEQTSVSANQATPLEFVLTNPNAALPLTGVSFSDALPGGLTIVANGLSGSCGGGTITAAPGTGVISLTGATLAPGGACSFSVNVTASAPGTYLNTTGAVASTEGGTGNAAASTLTVVSPGVFLPPVIRKLFAQSPILAGQTTPLTFTITSASPLGSPGTTFSDTLPAGLVIATPNGFSGGCGSGAVTAVSGTSVISLAPTSIPGGSSCSFSVNVLATAAGTFVNTTTNVTNTTVGPGNQAVDVLVVVPARTPQPPVLSKFFEQTSVSANQATPLEFVLTNPNAALPLTGVSFSDALPGGLTIVANGLSGSCGGGTITAAPGTGVISLTGATLAPGGACSFSVNVTASAPGTYLNTTGAVASTEGGTGNAAASTLTVVSPGVFLPPVIRKLFAQSPILAGQTTPLTFTITSASPLGSPGTTFSDTLPAGLVIATPNGFSGGCGSGAVTAVSGTSVISLAPTSIPGGSSCSFSVNVLATAAGTFVNTTTNVTNTTAGPGNQAVDVLVVVPARTPQPPVLSKFFEQTSVSANQATPLEFVLTNPNAALPLTGVSFSDALPGGLTIVANGLSGSCGGGTITAAPGTGVISLTGATLAPGGACSFSVNVTASAPGTYLNTTGAVASTEGGTGNAAASTLTVVSPGVFLPPVIRKLFAQSPILAGQTTPLTFTITSASPLGSPGTTFSDTLPAGLVIATPNGFSGGCGSGAVTAVSGTSVISLAPTSIPGGSSCSFSVNVLATAAGTFVNTTTNVTNTTVGPGNQAVDVLVVVPARTPQPPVLSKFFEQTSVSANQATPLEFVLTNPNAALPLTGVSFSDALPGGLTIVANGLSGSCGGGTITAAPGTGVISLTGATLAPGGACSFSVNVTASAPGTYLNTTGAVASTEGGTGNAAASTLTVVSPGVFLPPVIRKLFAQSPILAGQTTPLTFTITSASPLGSPGTTFSDTLPAGLVIATPNGFSGGCGSGAVTAVSGTSVISLAPTSIPGGSSCSFSVNVLATAAGTFVNTTTNVTNTTVGPGNQAVDVLVVVPARPPVISKSFAPSRIIVNGLTSLTFTISNPNPNPTLTNIGISDMLPAGLAVSGLPGNPLTGMCAGGAITAVPGSGVISLAGATLAAGSSCTFSVMVTAPEGQYSNVATATATGAGFTLTSAPGTANLSVANPPILTKSFAQVSMGPKATVDLTFTLKNSNATTTLTGVAFDDPLPAGLKFASPVMGVCDSGTFTAAANGTSISLAGASLSPGATCTFVVKVIADGTAPGLLTNISGAPTSVQSPAGNPATASIFIGDPFQVTYVSNLSLGDSVINITNTGASGASLQSGTTASITGALCANIYAFSPDEQLVSCCACPVTPNGLVSLSARNDLIANTLTPAIPTSLVVEVIATVPVGGSCTNSAAAVGAAALANGVTSFGTTIHAMNTAGNYALTERPFSSATLSVGQLSRVGALCNFILANGSGFGVCRSCRLGGLGAESQ